jgi:antitoxin MazE
LIPVLPGYKTHAGCEMGQQSGGPPPASVVDALELKEGDEIEIHVADEREFGVSRKPGREELLKRLRAFRGRLPADFKFDRDEANAR